MLNFGEELISILEQKLNLPLPGRTAHLKMAGRLPLYQKELSPPDNVRVAGVLVHLYQKDNDWYLTLMERTDHGPHSGQISFPGGGVEENDKNLTATALREAQEEVGISPQDVTILGHLTPLHIPVSNSIAHPTVGYSKQAPLYSPDPKEVKSVIEAPLSHFFLPENLKARDMTVGNGFLLKQVPYFDINGHVVWGATAMMLSEFFELVNG